MTIAQLEDQISIHIITTKQLIKHVGLLEEIEIAEQDSYIYK